jgi:hypothetical protein
MLLQAMADDPASAGGTGRRQHLDRALDIVERVRLTCLNDLEGYVVLIAVGFAGDRSFLPLPDGGRCGAVRRLAAGADHRINAHPGIGFGKGVSVQTHQEYGVVEFKAA